MYKYGVRMLKNRFFPVNVPEDVEIKHGEWILIATEKGQETAKAERIPSCVIRLG